MSNWRSLVDHLMAVPEGVYEHYSSNGGWDNLTKFGKEYGEDGVSWCAIFEWDMFHDVALDGIVPKLDNVASVASWAKQRGQYSQYPSVGAEVNFGPGVHTEIVIGFDADNVYTKGGNSIKAGATDNGQGNGVWSHSHARTSSYVAGYTAPRFPDKVCPPTADPNDPRGGKAVTSWRWTAPATTPTSTGGTVSLTAADQAVIQQAVVAAITSQPVRDTIGSVAAYWVGQGVAGNVTDGMTDFEKTMIPALHAQFQAAVKAAT